MTATRRVHQLRVTAPRDDLARRGALLLEDALHTASLPDDGRVLIVRTLRVGSVRVGSASASIARDVEHSVAELVSHAVHALDPAAASADVVYFRDVQESIASLTIRIAQQRSTSAWFWRLAVPAWRPSMSRDEALRVLLFASLDTPVGRVGASELVRTLAEKRALEPLLGALKASDGAQLLAASGWRAALSSAGDSIVPLETNDDRVLPTAAMARLQRWVAQWGAQDPRAAWLACALLVAERPLRAMSGDLPRVARALVRAAASSQRVNGGEVRDDATSPDVEQRRDVLALERDAGQRMDVANVAAPTNSKIVEQRSAETLPDLGGTDVRRDEPPNPDDETSEIDVAHADDATTTAPSTSDEGGVRIMHELSPDIGDAKPEQDVATSLPPQRAAATPAQPTRDATDASALGGLFLLLPVMARLGLPAQLEISPELIEADFPRRLLHYLAKRLGADDRDAALRAVAIAEEEAWRRELVRWTVRMRAWSFTNTGLTMRAIARRRARIAATRTHIDVHFPLSQADVRIRRTGLDIDPGWLPWFGRVVRFHYQQERGDNGT